MHDDDDNNDSTNGQNDDAYSADESARAKENETDDDAPNKERADILTFCLLETHLIDCEVRERTKLSTRDCGF